LASVAPRVDLRLAEVVESLGTWSSGPGSLYLKLANAARAGITRGELRPGSRLPPERTLAKALAVSRTTVVAAYDVLRQEELVARRHGSGTYVRRRPPLALWPSVDLVSSVQTTTYRDKSPDGDGPIEFTAATFPGGEVISPAAIEDFLAELPRLYQTHGYSVLGIPRLREGVARYFTSFGLKTVKDQILITTGAQQAICLTATLLIEPGEVVLVEDPTWVGAVDAFKASRARIISVPVDREGLVVEACREFVMKLSPRLLYLSPSFHNPTGVLMSERRRRELVLLMEETHLPVLEDNTLTDLVVSSQQPLPLPLAERSKDLAVFTVGSMSKLFWGGLRIGWIRASEPMVARLAHIKLVMDHGSSILSQGLAATLLDDIDAARRTRLAQIKTRLETMTGLLEQLLPEWHWHPPAGGLSLWVTLPRGNATEFGQVALRNGVAIVPGSVLSASHSHIDCLRLPFVQEPERLAEGVRRLAHSWAAYIAGLDHRSVHQSVI